MYIASIQLEHSGSFLETQEIPLSKGFNVIVGPNNSGKSTLANVLTLKSSGNKHLSIHTKPESFSTVEGVPIAKFQIRISSQDLKRYLGSQNEFWVKFNQKTMSAPDFGKSFVEKWRLDQLPSVYVRLKNSSGAISVGTGESSRLKHAVNIQKNAHDQWVYNTMAQPNSISDQNLLVENMLLSLFREDVYFFSAERLGLSKSPLNQDNHGNLKSNAENLPSVLNWIMSRNKILSEEYIQLIREIFPDIYDITAPVVDSKNGQVEIHFWITPPETKRDDLTFSLAQSGTGIGQVMAMLYVVINSTYPQVVIIDEPQSFLHPGAIRKLFNILKQYDHQYIITTHSPIVISAANPDTLLLLRKENYQSYVTVINQQEKAQMNQVLRSVGASLSDVFGADDVLWVEGETEQECFPLIIQRLSDEISLRGTVIHSVVATGDFSDKKSKNVKLVFKIYERLTNNVALIPPAFGFIFDTEELSKKDRDDLKRLSKDENDVERISFLPCMMYENYLLNVEAISFILNSSQYVDLETAPEQIQQWIEDNLWVQDENNETKWNNKYFGRRKPSDDFTLEDALETVHGAKLLKDLYKHFTENTLEYDKVFHGVALTKWLIENDPNHLTPLVEFLEQQMAKWQPAES